MEGGFLLSAPKLDLYYFDSCFFCQKVLRCIDKHGIKVNYMDVSADRSHAKKLQKDTGRRTVPCLYIDGKPMHESDDIIQWLEENLDQIEKS